MHFVDGIESAYRGERLLPPNSSEALTKRAAKTADLFVVYSCLLDELTSEFFLSPALWDHIFTQAEHTFPAHQLIYEARLLFGQADGLALQQA
jgi:hypothetical protein